MTSPVYRFLKKQDSYEQLLQRNRILTRKLRDTLRRLSCQIKNVEGERDRYKKQVDYLSCAFAALRDRRI